MNTSVLFLVPVARSDMIALIGERARERQRPVSGFPGDPNKGKKVGYLRASRFETFAILGKASYELGES